MAVALLTFTALVGLVGLWAAGALTVKTRDGTVVLEHLPPDADVTIDGGSVTVKSSDGKTFEVRVDATKKRHRVEVRKDGFKVPGEEVEVEPGGRQSVLVRLEPAAPATPQLKSGSRPPVVPPELSGSRSRRTWTARSTARGRSRRMS